MNISSEIFSERLRKLLRTEQITGYELSVRTNIALKSIHNWLQGRYYPSPLGVLKLADYFKVSSDYLLGLEDRYLEIETKSQMSLKEIQVRLIEKLTVYLRKNKITKYRLAKNLGIGQSTLSRWFKKESMPETSTLIKIAKLLELSLKDLLDS